MKLLCSLASAFLMYSRIPTPRVEWKEENRRYSLCFFPLVGAVIGGIFLGWFWLCDVLNISSLLFASISCVIPVIISGGIHLDGFCDVSDAKNSYAPRERKLEIMSDPHIGSFAVISLCVYFLVQFGLFSEVKFYDTAAIIALGYTLSRILSALAAVLFKSAKTGGALQSFTVPAHKKITVITLCLELLAVCAGMAFISLPKALAAIIFAGLSLAFYRIFSYKKFGGITGDLAGYFLQICELAILLGTVISEIIERLIL